MPLPNALTPPPSPPKRGSRVMEERHGESSVQWQWQTPAETRHRLGPMLFSADYGTLLPDADPQICP